MSTVSSGHLLDDLAFPGPKVLHGFNNIHFVFHLANDNMLAVQPLSLGSVGEKLGTILCWDENLPWTRYQDPYASG